MKKKVCFCECNSLRLISQNNDYLRGFLCYLFYIFIIFYYLITENSTSDLDNILSFRISQNEINIFFTKYFKDTITNILCYVRTFSNKHTSNRWVNY